MDDEAGWRLVVWQGQSTVMRYGSVTGEYRAEEIVLRAGETRFVMKTPHGDVAMRSPLTGRVNVYNLLAASCAALARGLTLKEIATAAEKLGQVAGRFEVVPGSNEAGFTVVVDYAHTDDALRNLIALARELAKERWAGDYFVWVWWGSRPDEAA